MRLIDADALNELLIENLEKIKKNPTMTDQEIHIICASHMLGNMIHNAKTIDAVPVDHAKWIPSWEPLDLSDVYVHCSACRTNFNVGTEINLEMAKHCPNCGRPMDGDQDDEP